MKWVTRKKASVDRIAFPWLNKRFIDPGAAVLYVGAPDVAAVAKREGAVPYDVAGVELGHVDGRCSFESIIVKYRLKDPALDRLALIVHGFAIVHGEEDHRKIELESPLYDALYAWCQHQAARLEKAG